jgi:hypothetical protein
LVLFYLGRYADAAQQLRNDAVIYEAKFEENGTDERLWALAADALAQTPPSGEPAAELPFKESNIVRAKLYTLFTEGTAAALAEVQALMTPEGEQDPMGRRFYGDLYLSLWYEMQGDTELAKHHMLAAKQSSHPKLDDFWRVIPEMHVRYRGWET